MWLTFLICGPVLHMLSDMMSGCSASPCHDQNRLDARTVHVHCEADPPSSRFDACPASTTAGSLVVALCRMHGCGGWRETKGTPKDLRLWLAREDEAAEAAAEAPAPTQQTMPGSTTQQQQQGQGQLQGASRARSTLPTTRTSTDPDVRARALVALTTALSAANMGSMQLMGSVVDGGSGHAVEAWHVLDAAILGSSISTDGPHGAKALLMGGLGNLSVSAAGEKEREVSQLLLCGSVVGRGGLWATDDNIGYVFCMLTA